LTDGEHYNPLLAPFLTFTDRNGTPDSDTTPETRNIEAQHAIDLTSALRLTYGANYRYNTMSSNVIAGFSTENRLGFCGSTEWRATQALTAIAGVRYDLDTFINPTVSPRVALLYNLAPIRK
jgi:iron complex outermembrane receptor protein